MNYNVTIHTNGGSYMKRCFWAKHSDIEKEYHDTEWGVPCYDDRMLFEMLNLEGQQSGLSWKTILQKRKSYREAFYNFNPDKIVEINEEEIESLLLNPGIIRYRLKIEAIIKNAHAYIKLREESTLSDYLWKFVNNEVIVNDIGPDTVFLTQTKISQEISKDLKKRGFAFVGPTTIYAFMQAVGMVNDHENDCFRKEV